MTNGMDRDRKARELSAWGADLKKRLAAEIDLVPGRLAQTEEHVADTFERRVSVAPARAHELWSCAGQVRAAAKRLRSKQVRLRMAMLPGRLDE
jgi:hypothetical protein